MICSLSPTVLEENNEITHSKVSSTKTFNYQENGYTYFVYYKNAQQKSFNQLKARTVPLQRLSHVNPY